MANVAVASVKEDFSIDWVESSKFAVRYGLTAGRCVEFVAEAKL